MKKLSSVAEQFILHWGEMSSRWGVNRSMAQIHALLYLSEKPLNAEEITGTLSLARSNVSTSLRELQAWGLITVIHQLGDRRDFYQAMDDPWELVQTIIEQRKRREIDPTITMLRQCLEEGDKAMEEDSNTRRRMLELLDLLDAINSWYDQMVRLPRKAQKKVLNLGSKLRFLARDGNHNTNDKNRKIFSNGD
jgi:DNA-binding transcriptional regulator GbsR (MarR family)